MSKVLDRVTAIQRIVLLLCVIGQTSSVFRKKIQIPPEKKKEELCDHLKIEYEGWEDPCFYNTMESAMDVFKSSVVQFGAGSKSLLSLFINKCFSSPPSWDNKNADVKRSPFINIEGNLPRLRDAVAKNVSKAMKGQLLTNPPRCFVPVQYIYGDRTHELHRPYRALGMYGSSHSAKAHWVRKPVIMTGYWYDLTTATVTDLYSGKAVPPPNSSVYTFPKDLIKPDITLFINAQELPSDSWEDDTEENVKTADRFTRFTENFLKFPHATIHEVRWTGTENITGSILELINLHLGKLSIK